jgi:hypothetical protein
VWLSFRNTQQGEIIRAALIASPHFFTVPLVTAAGLSLPTIVDDLQSLPWSGEGVRHLGLQIEFIAAYQGRTLAAITQIPPVAQSIHGKDSAKLVVPFAKSAHKTRTDTMVKNGEVSALQNLRYTIHDQFEKAKNLDDIWSGKGTKVAQ